MKYSFRCSCRLIPVILLTLLMGFVCLGQDVDERLRELAPIKLPMPNIDMDAITQLDVAIDRASADDELVNLYVTRAEAYASAQQWSKSALDFRRAAEITRTESRYWMRGGVMLLLAGDRMGYQAFIEYMIKTLKDTEFVYAQERVAKMCVLPKDPIGERAFVEELVDKSVRDSADSPWAEYFPSTQALVRYRYEKYEQALNSIDDSNKINKTTNQSEDVTTINQLIEAMCHARLGNQDKAKDAFRSADERLRRELANPDLVRDGSFWHDWMIAKLLHDEARAVLAKKSGNKD